MAMSRAKLEVKDFDPRPPPVIRQGPQNQTLPINSEAMLRCTSLGEPLPRISWYKDERPVDDANWLPVPEGPYLLGMRVYEGHAQVINCDWFPPSLTALKEPT